MILGFLGNAGRWKRVKDIKMTDIESFTVNMYPDGYIYSHSIGIQFRKYQFLVPFFRRFYYIYIFILS